MKNNILHIFASPHPEEIQAKRLTGHSTGIALRCIATAILTPGKEVLIQDHINKPMLNAILANTVKGIIAKLELVGMVVWRDRRGLFFVQFRLLNDVNYNNT